MKNIFLGVAFVSTFCFMCAIEGSEKKREIEKIELSSLKRIVKKYANDPEKIKVELKKVTKDIRRVKGKQGECLVHWAASCSIVSLEVLKVILDLLVDTYLPDKESNQPLVYATDPEKIKLLFNTCGFLNLGPKSALLTRILGGDEAAVKTLVELGAEPNGEREKRCFRDLLKKSKIDAHDWKLITLFVESGVEIGSLEIELAKKINDEGNVKKYLLKNKKLHILRSADRIKNPMDACLYIIKNEKLTEDEKIDLLKHVEEKRKLVLADLFDYCKENLLHKWARMEYAGELLFKFLLQKGVKFLRNESEKSPLSLVIGLREDINNTFKKIDLLIDAGFDINECDKYGWSYVDQAIFLIRKEYGPKWQASEIFIYLIKKGEKITATSIDNCRYFVSDEKRTVIANLIKYCLTYGFELPSKFISALKNGSDGFCNWGVTDENSKSTLGEWIKTKDVNLLNKKKSESGSLNKDENGLFITEKK